MNSNVLKLVTLTFSRPKEVSTKKTHLIFECFFRYIFNPSFFWWWFNRPFSVLYRNSQWHESCQIEADYAGHRPPKKRVCCMTFSRWSRKAGNWLPCEDPNRYVFQAKKGKLWDFRMTPQILYQIQLPSLKPKIFEPENGMLWKTWLLRKFHCSCAPQLRSHQLRELDKWMTKRCR